MNELKTLSSHFRFGDNWRSFVEGVDATSIENAVASLRTLFPNDDLAGASVLDIGCGSGLSMLSAASLGAASVQGIDIDPASVEATRRLLGQHLDTDRWSARELSIFDASPDVLGTFDVVHSWGVLHHTGDMWTAIRQAAALVAPGGLFALALYRKTPLCGLWRVEKRFYTNASPRVQAAVRSVYKRIFSLGLRMTGRDLATYVADYASTRGMDWEHDVHDWLGGYPYESVTPQELLAVVGPLGFEPVRVIEKRANIAGILGTHCDEFVFRKRNAD